jgi:hypothetical protein
MTVWCNSFGIFFSFQFASKLKREPEMLLRKNKLSVIYLDQNLGSTTIKNGLY